MDWRCVKDRTDEIIPEFKIRKYSTGSIRVLLIYYTEESLEGLRKPFIEKLSG